MHQLLVICFITLCTYAQAWCNDVASNHIEVVKPSNISVNIIKAWARPAAHGHNSAIYMMIDNTSDKDFILTKVSSEVSDVVELHKTKCKKHRCRMIPVKKIICPAHSQTELKPGGLHIMLIRLKQSLKDNQNMSVPIVLEFGNGQKISINALVQNSVKKPTCCHENID